MAVFSYSAILSKGDVQFFLNLLPKEPYGSPDIYIFDDWNTIVSMTNLKNELYQRYTILKTIIKNRIFSTFNYEHNMIFIYLFNLPYKDRFLTALHGVFCLFHEIRHYQQFMSERGRFLSHNQSFPLYSHSWSEKDANKYAVRWIRRNRTTIHKKLQLPPLQWDVRVNEQKRLRIITCQNEWQSGQAAVTLAE